MIKEILTASGLPFRQGRFINPPTSTYAVVFDDHDVSGPDVLSSGSSVVVRHDCMVELYEPKHDPDAESALESALLSYGIAWTKEDGYWLQNVQRYQVIYEFTYYEKRRI